MVLSRRVPDIGALDLLLSVARLGSLGQAAREHGISQPAAGSRMRHLESVLGISLIERSSAGSRLTAEGKVVVDWARDVVAAAETLDAGVSGMRSGHQTRLRIGASLTIAEYLLPSWLTALRALHPRATVEMQVVNSAEVVRLIQREHIGLGFVEGPTVAANLDSMVLGHDSLVAVVHPDHPWARRRRPISIEQLAATPLVQRERGSGTRDTVELILADRDDVAGPLVELSSTTAIKAAVGAGVAPAVLSRLAVADELQRGELVAVDIDAELTRELRAVWVAGRRLESEYRDVLAVASRER